MELNTYCNWPEEEIARLAELTSYAQMAEVALAKLKTLPHPVLQVCGPLSTGGRGSFPENLKVFGEAIRHLSEQGRNVFDQRPFEIPMQKIKLARSAPGYAYDLLAEFYLPIFESRLIDELHFLPGWEGSTGSRWEHEQALRLGIPTAYFPADWLEVESRI